MHVGCVIPSGRRWSSAARGDAVRPVVESLDEVRVSFDRVDGVLVKVGAHGPEHLALPQVPRVRRFVGRPDARLRSPWHVRPAPRGGRRRAGFLERAAECVPRDQEGPLPVPQGSECGGGASQAVDPGAGMALVEIWGTADQDHARAAVAAFGARLWGKIPPRPPRRQRRS